MYKILIAILMTASLSFGAFTAPDAGVVIGNEAVTNTYNGVLDTNAVMNLIGTSTNALYSDVMTAHTLDMLTIPPRSEFSATNTALNVLISANTSSILNYTPLTSTNAIITKAVADAATAGDIAYTPITPSEREFSNGWKIEASGTNLIFTYTAP